MQVCAPQKDNREGKENFSVYVEYSRTLRIWLVAYGIGGPVLFLTQTEISKKILESGHALIVVSLFFLGVFSQIFIALLNKYVNWYLYCYADPENRKYPRLYEWVKNVSQKIEIDIGCDLVSMLAFPIATVWGLLICAI
jgi:hypothetical protein